MTATASPAGPAASAELVPGATEVTLRFGGLLRAELRRLRLRRLLVLAVLAYLALLLVGLVGQFLSHTKDNAAARADAQRNYESSLASCRSDASRPTDPTGAPLPCEELLGGVDSFFFDRTYYVVQALPGSIVAAAGTFAVVAFVLGASAIGAEWSARTLPALLVWEPRRVRVLLTKVAALLLVVAAVAVLVQVLVLGAGVLTGHLRGSFAPVTAPVNPYGGMAEPGSTYVDPTAPPVHQGSFWAALALQHARAVGLALVGAVLGFAVAAAARSTAAALGVAFAYFAVVEIGLRGLRPQWDPWLLTSNGLGWMQRGGHRIQLLRPEVNPESQTVSESSYYLVHLTNAETAAYLLVLAALALTAATVLFRRRDLT